MVYSNSEIGPLEKVIIHRPDLGISRISPKRAEELLFDDIVHLPTMQEEHDIFSDLLKSVLGPEAVYESQDLLLEALNENVDRKRELIAKALDYDELPASYVDDLIELDNEILVDVLITGYDATNDFYYFDPIPNFIFTRDIAVTVNDHVIITKAAKIARFRENLLTRFIFYTHPMFKELRDADKIINLNNIEKFPPSRYGETVSMEGGDIMIIENDYLLIGVSERSTDHAFRSIRDVLFEKKVVKHVVMVNIPSDRSCMHIDTLFTRIDKDHVVCFKPIVYEGKGSNVELFSIDGHHKTYSSIKDFFLNEINPDMKFVFSGGGHSPYQEREQWTDGCNLVALKPGVGITYDRNHRTGEAFQNMGFEIKKAEDVIKEIKEGSLKASDIENTIITVPSGELSRARGGSHCMTCPILRQSI